MKTKKQQFKLVIADCESNRILEVLGIFPNEQEAKDAGELYLQTFDPADLEHLEYQIKELSNGQK